MERSQVELTPEHQEQLDNLAKEEEDKLKRFPSWLRTGSQKDYDEWMLRPKRIAQIKGKIAEERANGNKGTASE
jgi:hypothetical protein